MSRAARRSVLVCLALLGLAALGSAPAAAHGFSTSVFVDVTSPHRGQVRTELGLEYDLLVVSAADAEHDDALFQDGTAAFDDGDVGEEAAALAGHADAVLAYVTERFSVSSADQTCAPAQVGGVTITQREGVPYAVLVLDHQCATSDGAHEVTATLFGDDEGYVRDAKTIVTYDLDGQHGSAAVDGARPTFSTEQTTGERFWEFFHLGAEHLLTGLDHIVFLLALIAGSRGLREVVLAATTFTLAHSITFILAATGLVTVPARVVEPIIALSIAVVAGWYLYRIWKHGDRAAEIDTAHGGPLGLDRAGWLRLGVVFCFGLVHGLGFASALGIDEAWSWTLLWSLLVFNVGIEAVQLSLILLLFPALTMTRYRVPRVGLWITGLVAAGVTVLGLVWFTERLLGLS
ncbi:HupE/UreJ family protein [Cellulomonas sp. URHD0024]|uniref:HupE/UreJ family protein n=1 Tax=Cellulomonas sp. URHD0024 TaxID=1302620 RepID=UPI0003FADDB9|nr:HupE/UreJ family protein [Cellulomonas sp. URHD0024]